MHLFLLSFLLPLNLLCDILMLSLAVSRRRTALRVTSLCHAVFGQRDTTIVSRFKLKL